MPAPVESDVAKSTDPEQFNEGLYENIAYYLKNDTLGKLSNLHVAICDQSPEGPKDDYAKRVAAMINV